MASRAHGALVVPLAAFAAGAVLSLLLGIYGSVHEPTNRAIATFGFGSVIEMKVYLAAAVGVLAVLQVIGALWLYGKLALAVPSWLGTAHRVTGALALLLSLPVAYHCLWAFGLQSGSGTSARVVVHGVVGCIVYGAVVVKVVAVRSGTAPGWLLPVAGGLLFTALMTVVWTSVVWYVGESGWP